MSQNTFITPRVETGLVERVAVAAIETLLESGMRNLRTAEIARRAETTEARLFRHFHDLQRILEMTFDWCWSVVNASISESNFLDPTTTDAKGRILKDFEALWTLNSDERSRNAAVGAFLYYRRPEQLATGGQTPPEQRKFEQRVHRLCELSLKESGDTATVGALTLQRLLINYAATVWLTWYCMPGDDRSADTGEHDLNRYEAQIGVRAILSQALGTDSLV